MKTDARLVRGALLAGAVVACSQAERRGDSANVGASTRPASAGSTSAPTPSSAPDSGVGRGAAPVPPARDAGSKSPPTPPPRGSSDEADSVRGIAAVVGTTMDSRVVIKPVGGGKTVTLVGDQAPEVGRLSGADIWVAGRRDSSSRLTVHRFQVRSIDGAPALDGLLSEREGRLLLVTDDGKEHEISNPPAALRQQVGSRVWVTGSLSTGAVIFGVIRGKT